MLQIGHLAVAGEWVSRALSHTTHHKLAVHCSGCGGAGSVEVKKLFLLVVGQSDGLRADCAQHIDPMVTLRFRLALQTHTKTNKRVSSDKKEKKKKKNKGALRL